MAIQAMIDGGAEEVALEAEVTNSGALALYRGLGFVRDKRLHRCAELELCDAKCRRQHVHASDFQVDQFTPLRTLTRAGTTCLATTRTA